MQDFADQVAAMRPMLVRTARRMLRNDAWAEDAVSETLVAALERPAAFGGGASVRTWLVAILKHKVVDQIRHHTREHQAAGFDSEAEPADWPRLAPDAVPGMASDAAAGWGDPQEQLGRKQFLAQLDECIQALPPRQGRAFLLRSWMEKETAEICDELGVTANNLSVMLHRANGRLRGLLQARWEPIQGGTQFV